MNTNGKWKYKPLGILLLILCVSVISYLSLISYVDFKLSERDYSQVYNHCKKIWSTRGLITDTNNRINDANSIESLTLAFQKGANGVEVDVYFDLALEKFIVSHDRPYNLKNGRLLTLENLFNALGDSGNYWLDFKKLPNLSDDDALKAAKRLNEISIAKNIKQRIYVESEDPINLGLFRDIGFKTLFDTQPLPDSYPATKFVANAYKVAFYFGGFSVMGLDYGAIDNPTYADDSRSTLENIPLFMYHVPNDDKLLKELSKDKNIRVLLNKDDTINSFDLDACQL
jgi:glycerophosphoryl diester phosphodiesterase